MMEHFDWLSGFVFPYINFILFFGAAVFLFRKPLRQSLQKRRAEFEALMAKATAAKNEAESRSKELQARLATLDAELAALRQSAKEDAERAARSMLESAQIVATNLREDAKRIAEAELNSARQGLRKEMIDLVRQDVETRFEQNYRPEQHAELIHKQVERMKQMQVEKH